MRALCCARDSDSATTCVKPQTAGKVVFRFSSSVWPKAFTSTNVCTGFERPGFCRNGEFDPRPVFERSLGWDRRPAAERKLCLDLHPLAKRRIETHGVLSTEWSNEQGYPADHYSTLGIERAKQATHKQGAIWLDSKARLERVAKRTAADEEEAKARAEEKAARGALAAAKKAEAEASKARKVALAESKRVTRVGDGQARWAEWLGPPFGGVLANVPVPSKRVSMLKNALEFRDVANALWKDENLSALLVRVAPLLAAAAAAAAPQAAAAAAAAAPQAAAVAAVAPQAALPPQ